jgi:hypothetical protein
MPHVPVVLVCHGADETGSGAVTPRTGQEHHEDALSFCETFPSF